MNIYKTEQENFWAGDFGNEYIERNNNKKILLGKINFFTKAIARTIGVKSIIEFGSNIGLNLDALNMLMSDVELSAIEINSKASDIISKKGYKVYNQSILDFQMDFQRDLVIICGVLIHINPERLKDVYQKLYETSKKYILINEYYNPTPVSVNYRGHDNKLFKRDFAGEMMDKYSDLVLVDYGFIYHRDNNFSQDDGTWFLLEKR
jgi:pseudaminic acid biosynthesis-associated methylase